MSTENQMEKVIQEMADATYIENEVPSGASIGYGAHLASLYMKIAKVTGEIGAVQRDKKHQQGYNYQSWEAIADHVSAALAKHNLACIPLFDMAHPVKVEEIGKSDRGTRMFRYTGFFLFVLADGDTGASMTVPWSVITDDWSDKAYAKMTTFAVKDFYRKLFVISDRDTEDADAGNETPLFTEGQQTQQTTQKPPPKSKTPPKTQQPPAAAKPTEPPPAQPGNVTKFENPKATKPSANGDLPKNRDTFTKFASALGYEQNAMLAVLDHYAFVKNAETGHVKYSEEQHDNMIAALTQWNNAFQVLYNAADPTDQARMNLSNSVEEVFDILADAGLTEPIKVETPLGKVANNYLLLLQKAAAIDDNFREILLERSITNLNVNKAEIILATLQEAVDSAAHIDSMVSDTIEEDAENEEEITGELQPISTIIGEDIF